MVGYRRDCVRPWMRVSMVHTVTNLCSRTVNKSRAYPLGLFSDGFLYYVSLLCISPLRTLPTSVLAGIFCRPPMTWERIEALGGISPIFSTPLCCTPSPVSPSSDTVCVFHPRREERGPDRDSRSSEQWGSAVKVPRRLVGNHRSVWPQHDLLL